MNFLLYKTQQWMIFRINELTPFREPQHASWMLWKKMLQVQHPRAKADVRPSQQLHHSTECHRETTEQSQGAMSTSSVQKLILLPTHLALRHWPSDSFCSLMLLLISPLSSIKFTNGLSGPPNFSGYPGFAGLWPLLGFLGLPLSQNRRSLSGPSFLKPF